MYEYLAEITSILILSYLESSWVDPAMKQPQEPGKPEFPILKKTKMLKDFFGPQSWTLFDLVEDEAKWLRLLPNE